MKWPILLLALVLPFAAAQEPSPFDEPVTGTVAGAGVIVQAVQEQNKVSFTLPQSLTAKPSPTNSPPSRPERRRLRGGRARQRRRSRGAGRCRGPGKNVAPHCRRAFTRGLHRAFCRRRRHRFRRRSDLCRPRCLQATMWWSSSSGASGRAPHRLEEHRGKQSR